MTVKPLTNAEVKSAKPREKDYSIYDGFGLLLVVRKGGSKAWHFRYYSPYTKKRQTLSIGPYPEISLAEAREARSEARKQLARGVDPNDVKRERIQQEKIKRASTVAALYEDWIKYKESRKLAKSTLRHVRQTFRKHILPAFGEQPVSRISPRVVLPHLNTLRDAGKLVPMTVAASHMRQLLDYAVNIGMIEYNPLIKISGALPKAETVNFKTITPAEFPAFLSAIDNAYEHERIKLLAYWQLLTMVRPTEAREATWSEIDLDNKEWVIPAARMKKRQYHVVPLSEQAITVLENMAAIATSDNFIFPIFSRNNSPMDSSRLCRLIAGTEFKGRIVPHGFRSLASTVLHEHGFNPDVIEAALAHKSKDVIRGIYNRSTYLEQRRIMMQWWADYVDAARNGEVMKSSGENGLRLIAG